MWLTLWGLPASFYGINGDLVSDRSELEGCSVSGVGPPPCFQVLPALSWHPLLVLPFKKQAWCVSFASGRVWGAIRAYPSSHPRVWPSSDPVLARNSHAQASRWVDLWTHVQCTSHTSQDTKMWLGVLIASFITLQILDKDHFDTVHIDSNMLRDTVKGQHVLLSTA